jgi:phage terminase large subunit-like protein
LPFSQQHADIACNFFECVLKHTLDEWYGKPFILAPWQEEAVSEIFGRLDDDGNRQIQQVYLEVPKKAGKTEMVAGIVLLALIMDPNPGCQVYGAAAATRQAMNIYRAACKMWEQAPILQKSLRLLRGTNRILKRRDPDSFYAAVAADGDLSDGVNPSVVAADELHRWRTRKQIENWDVLSLGGITRKQTLTIAITTAGVRNESPLAYRLHEKTLRIKEGVISDPTFYGRIYGASKTDDWTDEKTWIKANPSLIQNGGFLDIEKIRQKYQSSLSDSEGQRTFKRYYLNLWDEKERRAIDLADWDACKGEWDAVGLREKAPEDKIRPLDPDMLRRFFGRKCWAGVDLSMTTDMSALALVFESATDELNPLENGFDILAFYWLPEENIRKRELRDGMPYQTWAEQGFIELSPGRVIDYRDVKARIAWADEMFDLQEVCFDPWNSRQISVPMIEEGFRCFDVRQGFQTLNEPSKKLLSLVASRKLRHGGHPVLRWNAMCLSTREVNDNLMFSKPERSKDTARIDGIAAMVDALSRAILDDSGSIYDKRGILTL